MRMRLVAVWGTTRSAEAGMDKRMRARKSVMLRMMKAGKATGEPLGEGRRQKAEGRRGYRQLVSRHWSSDGADDTGCSQLWPVLPSALCLLPSAFPSGAANLQPRH